MRVKNTGDLALESVKILIYGQSGAGKTTLLSSLGNPIVLSAESGLLPLKNANLPYVEIGSLETFKEALMWLESSDDARAFKSVAVDSISWIAEVILSEELKKTKDGRSAYGEMQRYVVECLHRLRNLPTHLVLLAKLDKNQDELGRMLYGPSMPGRQLSQGIAHMVDEVLALRVEKGSDGAPTRALQTQSDGLWIAKDRSGKLGSWEKLDLTALISKILS